MVDLEPDTCFRWKQYYAAVSKLFTPLQTCVNKNYFTTVNIKKGSYSHTLIFQNAKLKWNFFSPLRFSSSLCVCVCRETKSVSFVLFLSMTIYLSSVILPHGAELISPVVTQLFCRSILLSGKSRYSGSHC